GELEADAQRFRALRADPAPGAVELLGPAIANERLERVEAEPSRVRVEGSQPHRTARVSDPRARRDPGGNGGYRSVGDAEEDEVGFAAIELATRPARGNALGEAGSDRAGAAGGPDGGGPDEPGPG